MILVVIFLLIPNYLLDTVLLWVSKNDIVPLFEACIDGKLAEHSLKWKSGSTVCVVMAAKGYPGSYDKGKEVSGLNSVENEEGTEVFHAGTKIDRGRVLTSGGRVLGVTAMGSNISTAIRKAYSAVAKIEWEGIHYRKDIGRKAK